MGLSIAGLKSSSSIGGNGVKKTQGVYVGKAIITSIIPHYNTQQKWQRKPDDIGLEMTLDIGRDFEPTFYVGGAFKRDEFGDIVNMGTVKKVDILLDSLGVDTSLTKDNKVPEDVLNDCIGREFLRLSYVSGERDDGRAKWSDWQETRRSGIDYNDFTKDFMTAVDNQWVRNFKPIEDEELAL
jgi:hypothetical protein